MPHGRHPKLILVHASKSRPSGKWTDDDYGGPRIIATDRQAPRIYPPMIPLCSRFDSVLFTPKMFAIASYGNYSRSPMMFNLVRCHRQAGKVYCAAIVLGEGTHILCK